MALVESLGGGRVPRMDPRLAKRTFAAVHEAIEAGLVRSCHDLSEGGLAVAAAEMAFAGGIGARLSLAHVPHAADAAETAVLLFSESNTRFLVEVQPEKAEAFEAALAEVPHAMVGEVVDTGKLEILGLPTSIPDEDEPAIPLVIDADLATLKEAWQKPLRW